VDSDSLMA